MQLLKFCFLSTILNKSLKSWEQWNPLFLTLDNLLLKHTHTHQNKTDAIVSKSSRSWILFPYEPFATLSLRGKILFSGQVSGPADQGPGAPILGRKTHCRTPAFLHWCLILGAVRIKMNSFCTHYWLDSVLCALQFSHVFFSIILG